MDLQIHSISVMAFMTRSKASFPSQMPCLTENAGKMKMLASCIHVCNIFDQSDIKENCSLIKYCYFERHYLTGISADFPSVMTQMTERNGNVDTRATCSYNSDIFRKPYITKLHCLSVPPFPRDTKLRIEGQQNLGQIRLKTKFRKAYMPMHRLCQAV